MSYSISERVVFMCGIVGFVGKSDGVNFILDGLKSLNYRGYDSAGISVFDENSKFKIIKKCGKLEVLSTAIKNQKTVFGNCVLGHTRWATHGAPSDVNAHPIAVKDVAVVHNGIIENFLNLKKILKSEGYFFATETDTEVVAALIDYFYDGKNCIDAILKAASKFEGSYALGIVFQNKPDAIFALRKGSSLNVGFGENENYISSDVLAFRGKTKRYSILDENEICVLTAGSVDFFNFNLEKIEKPVLEIDCSFDEADKGQFDSFMLKEIHDQPEVVRECFSSRINASDISFETDEIPNDWFTQFKRIQIVACGTAMHAGLFGKQLIEKIAKLPVEVSIASEFRYCDPVLLKHDLVIVVSQSGETADSLAALRLAKAKGVATLGVVNVQQSSIAREADKVVLTKAGPEIAVASTKAFTAQLAVFCLLSLKFAKELKAISCEEFLKYCEELIEVPARMEQMLNCKNEAFKLAGQVYKTNNLFFIGRGADYYLSLEGSLKLKEISYIHSEAYAAGELKHGTISLIEDGFLVIATATQSLVFMKTLSNVKEVKARGAKVLLICKENSEIEQNLADFIFKIPNVTDLQAPFCIAVFMQLFAYKIAVLRGRDVDMPRNLAKSVTVE